MSGQGGGQGGGRGMMPPGPGNNPGAGGMPAGGGGGGGGGGRAGGRGMMSGGPAGAGGPAGGVGGGGLVGDGGGIGGGGGGMSRAGGGNADPNSPEGCAEAFLKALAGQDKDALATGVSTRAAGDLAKIKKGDADEKVISKLAQSYGNLVVIRVAPVTKGDERIIVLGTSQTDTKKGSFKQLTLRKEENTWKVFAIK